MILRSTGPMMLLARILTESRVNVPLCSRPTSAIGGCIDAVGGVSGRGVEGRYGWGW